jgi:hypothetical protein
MDDCDITWHVSTDKAISRSGLIYYEQYSTVEDCVNGCAYEAPVCVAVQIRIRNPAAPIKCFVIANPNVLYELRDAKGVNLFVLTMKCVSGKGKKS